MKRILAFIVVLSAIIVITSTQPQIYSAMVDWARSILPAYSVPVSEGKDLPADTGNKTSGSSHVDSETNSALTDSQKPPEMEQVPPSGSTSSSSDTRTYSWWFKPNSSHKPPAFDAGLLDMVEGKAIYLGDPHDKIVYLTFDEGYENGFTSTILDILKENQVSATFFVTGNYVDKNPELVTRMANEGHVIGNHTNSHPSLSSLSDTEIKKEVVSTGDKVFKLTGVKMHFIRPPMGEFNPRVLDILNSLGYKAVFWSMAFRDWLVDDQPGKEKALRGVMDNLHPGAIILLHAVSSSNTQALDQIIDNVRAEGYRFCTLSEL